LSIAEIVWWDSQKNEKTENLVRPTPISSPAFLARGSLIALMMEEVSTFETSVKFCETTRRYIILAAVKT
jgi:hypothetical protein